jgi:hypothetical protein
MRLEQIGVLSWFFAAVDHVAHLCNFLGERHTAADGYVVVGLDGFVEISFFFYLEVHRLGLLCTII